MASSMSLTKYLMVAILCIPSPMLNISHGNWIYYFRDFLERLCSADSLGELGLGFLQ